MTSDVDLVELELPLSARYASTARVVAASLAADVGFTVDEIDDLRIGLNEAVSVAADVDDDAAAAGRLHLRFEVDAGTITVHVRRTGVTAEAITVDPLAERILTAVVDSFAVDGHQFVLSKSAAGADAGPAR